jgi:threonine synthase
MPLKSFCFKPMYVDLAGHGRVDFLMPFVSHLECANCGKDFPAGEVHGLCTSCQRPLWVRYDLDAVKEEFPKKALFGRPPTLWRYLELLPPEDPGNIVSLTETITPILPVPRLSAEFGLKNLLIKDESRLPTGSFKARGMAMAVTMAKELGLKILAAPTAGNAGGALAAYSSRAGLESWVFMPEDTPHINQMECMLAGANVFAVNGLIDDCGKIVREGKEQMNWFDVSTLKEPYRIEGKKTMGLELAEQFEWELPDWIFYPTGGGTGLIGMWKAFSELETLGWLKDKKRPKMVACQSDGCAPIVNAFKAGNRHAKRVDNAQTIASGLRVPQAVGDFMILDAVRESDGAAIAAPENEIPKWMKLANTLEGIALCPETAVCLDALDQLAGQGRVNPKDRVLIFNTGAAQKYPEAVTTELPRINLDQPIDWNALAHPSA